MGIYRKILFFLVFALQPQLSQAWSLHYIVTDYSLRPGDFRYLDEKYGFESLDSFVRAEAPGFSKLVKEYYDWLETKGSKRFAPMTFDENHPTTLNFLKALRLNPKTKFEPVLKILPGENFDPSNLISFTEISPGEDTNHNFNLNFRRILPQEKVSARAILYTASDEPDWQFDHGLWNIPEYGYGKIPFGDPNRSIDKAPFHMQFAHESFFLKLIAPEIQDGLVDQRLELFTRLAEFAFKTHHPYWGYRFTGFALHYIQDISQPYHARALPFESIWFYVKYLMTTDKAKYKAQAAHDLENRHISFEDLLASLLQQSYELPQVANQKLVGSLTNSGSISHFINTPSAEKLFREVSTHSAKTASTMDEAVMEVFGPKFKEHPEYQAATDVGFDHLKLASTLEPKAYEKFILASADCLKVAGEATRALVRIIHEYSQNPKP